jgi:hypothetical protein
VNWRDWWCVDACEWENMCGYCVRVDVWLLSESSCVEREWE